MNCYLVRRNNIGISKRDLSRFTEYLLFFQFFGGYVFALYVFITFGLYFSGFAGFWISLSETILLARLIRRRSTERFVVSSADYFFMFFFSATVFSMLLNIQIVSLNSSVLLDTFSGMIIFCLGPYIIGKIYSKSIYKSLEKIIWLFFVHIILFSISDFYFTLSSTGRLFASVGHSTTIALMSSPVFLWLFFRMKSIAGKMIMLFIIVVILTLSGSRSMLLTAFLVLILCFVLRKQRLYNKLISLTFAAILVVFATFLFVKVSELFENQRILSTFRALSQHGITETFRSQGGERSKIIAEYLSHFRRLPIVGFGNGLQTGMRWDPHNSLVEILGKAGLIGFVPFIFIGLVYLYKAFEGIREALESPYGFLALYFVILFTESLFTGSIYINLMFWFVVGILSNPRNHFLDSVSLQAELAQELYANTKGVK